MVLSGFQQDMIHSNRRLGGLSSQFHVAIDVASGHVSGISDRTKETVARVYNALSWIGLSDVDEAGGGQWSGPEWCARPRIGSSEGCSLLVRTEEEYRTVIDFGVHTTECGGYF